MLKKCPVVAQSTFPSQKCFKKTRSYCAAGTRDRALCQRWAIRKDFIAISILKSTTLNYTPPHYAPPHSVTLHYNQIDYTTPHHSTPHQITLTTTTATATTTLLYTALHQTTEPYSTLHHITLYPFRHHACNRNYATPSALHHNYNSTTLQLQLQLQYTTLHPPVVVRCPLQPLHPLQKKA